MAFLEFLALAYTLGPAAAIPYGMQFMTDQAIIAILFICYTLPLPVMFKLLDFFNYSEKCNIRIIDSVIAISRAEARKVRAQSDRVIKKFNTRWGYAGYYAALAFLSFALGFLWATVIAYILKLEKIPSYAAIAVGTVAGLVFWSGIAIGAIQFMDPAVFSLSIVMIAGVSFVYGRVREHKVVRMIAKTYERPKRITKKVLKTSTKIAIAAGKEAIMTTKSVANETRRLTKNMKKEVEKNLKKP